MLIKSIFKYGLITIFFIISLIELTLQRITISSPDNLAKKFNYEKIRANFATFGKVPYGYNFIGNLHYDLNDKDSDYACKPLAADTIKFEGGQNNYPIIMVDRGNCTFVTKARNVQRAGGLFAIIINNEDEDIDMSILVDDGTGSDIYIPTALISKNDGEKIKKYMQVNINSPEVLSQIVLSIEFKMPQNTKVEYQFFFTSSNIEMYKLFKSFNIFQKVISNVTDFRPHYITYKSPEYDPNVSKSVANCISKGLYCATPKYDIGVTDGRDILNENIRQKCIYLISNGIFKNSFLQQNLDKSLYWNYMETFYDKCLNQTIPQFNNKCSVESLKAVGINEDIVNDCVMSSYVAEKDKIAIDLNNNNSILEEEYNVKKKWKIKIFPTIMVNNKTLQGTWNTDNLLEAICAGFYQEKPQVCYDKGYFFNYAVEMHGVAFSTIFLIILILIVINGLIYLLCRRYIIKRINERVDKVDINGRINNVVSNYLALKDTPNL